MISDISNILKLHFSDCLKSIYDVSYNETNSRPFYTGDFELYCLDSIVSKHFNVEPKSADGIYLSDRAIFLIEFKEGKQRNIKGSDVKLKLFEALNSLYKVICDKSPSSICKKDFWDQKIHYIVIYRDDEKESPFQKRLSRTIVKWGLDEYKGLYITSATTEYNPLNVQEIFEHMTRNQCGTLRCLSA